MYSSIFFFMEFFCTIFGINFTVMDSSDGCNIKNLVLYFTKNH